MTVTATLTRSERREDFPVKTLQYLESRLGSLRKVVMELAARLAALDATDSDAYRVEFSHVDRAIREVLRDSSRYAKDLGLGD
jgi:hypothetical protein